MLRLWHNPRCSKSRAALALLEERGAAPEIFRYLETPPDAAMLDAVLGKLGLSSAAQAARHGEAAWRECGLTPESAEADIRAAMLAHPILIERPILESTERAVIGRPPEAVLGLI